MTAIGLGYRSKNKRYERSEVQSTKGKAFDEVNRETDGWSEVQSTKGKAFDEVNRETDG
jgi:hypothetical protein